jgi:hypothetical protein
MAFIPGLTGLREPFAGRIFSVEDVAHGKPAPDVFLHAARSMHVEPAWCTVVEDSASGVAAGRAAGMAVVAYAGGVTPARRLVGDGVADSSVTAWSSLGICGSYPISSASTAERRRRSTQRKEARWELSTAAMQPARKVPISSSVRVRSRAQNRSRKAKLRVATASDSPR